uniref:Uncharacterized protein n=1 Tax=Arundo donax TaxID=35708 RepID=A0A0A8XSS2_ARUDO
MISTVCLHPSATPLSASHDSFFPRPPTRSRLHLRSFPIPFTVAGVIWGDSQGGSAAPSLAPSPSVPSSALEGEKGDKCGLWCILGGRRRAVT